MNLCEKERVSPNVYRPFLFFKNPAFSAARKKLFVLQEKRGVFLLLTPVLCLIFPIKWAMLIQALENETLLGAQPNPYPLRIQS